MGAFQLKQIVGLAVVVGALVAPIQAFALSLHTDRVTWEAAALSDGLLIADVDISATLGSDFDVLTAGNPLALPFSETITFGNNLERRSVPANWATWSGGNTPIVLYTLGAFAVTGTFDKPVVAFGVEMEPNPFDVLTMALILDGGTQLIQDVNGSAGAKFFGWTGGAVSEITMACRGCDFAFGRMVKGEVPEPSTMLLLGSGLLGLVIYRMKKKASSISSSLN